MARPPAQSQTWSRQEIELVFFCFGGWVWTRVFGYETLFEKRSELRYLPRFSPDLFLTSKVLSKSARTWEEKWMFWRAPSAVFWLNFLKHLLNNISGIGIGYWDSTQNVPFKALHPLLICHKYLMYQLYRLDMLEGKPCSLPLPFITRELPSSE